MLLFSPTVIIIKTPNEGISFGRMLFIPPAELTWRIDEKEH